MELYKLITRYSSQLRKYRDRGYATCSVKRHSQRCNSQNPISDHRRQNSYILFASNVVSPVQPNNPWIHSYTLCLKKQAKLFLL